MPVLLAEHSFDCNLCHVVARHGGAPINMVETESRFITPHFAAPKSYFSLAMLSGSLRTFPSVPDSQWSLFSGLSAVHPCRRYLRTDCEPGQSSLETMPPFPGKLRAGLGHVLHCHPSQDLVLSCICIFGSSLPWPVFGTTGLVMLGQNSADITLANTKLVGNVRLF